MDNWDPAGLTVVLAVLIAALAAYVTGCVHQWSRQGLERRAAFCRGYDHAAGALITVAGPRRGGDHQPNRTAASPHSPIATHLPKDR
ncbi:hypothetical protein GCM10020358_81270 [Amorphoplanes nipponensis]|uniref:Uncharacterized protein n=2 Tax=Actinoplanes nipponensis TaxID=135950 RepID=A0A919JE34_9ACTN|nr:hypothetical protein Ani05nite_12140 [Actinoplanes nipponensis]